jgi:hypothetical protein
MKREAFDSKSKEFPMSVRLCNGKQGRSLWRQESASTMREREGRKHERSVKEVQM